MVEFKSTERRSMNDSNTLAEYEALTAPPPAPEPVRTARDVYKTAFHILRLFAQAQGDDNGMQHLSNEIGILKEENEAAVLAAEMSFKVRQEAWDAEYPLLTRDATCSGWHWNDYDDVPTNAEWYREARTI